MNKDYDKRNPDRAKARYQRYNKKRQGRSTPIANDIASLVVAFAKARSGE